MSGTIIGMLRPLVRPLLWQLVPAVVHMARLEEQQQRDWQQEEEWDQQELAVRAQAVSTVYNQLGALVVQTVLALYGEWTLGLGF